MPSFLRDSFSNLKQELATYQQRRAPNATPTPSDTPELQHGLAAAAVAADTANASLTPADSGSAARAPLGLPAALPATVPVAHRGTLDSPISVPSGTASDPASAYCTANLQPSPPDPAYSQPAVHPAPQRPSSAPLQSNLQSGSAFPAVASNEVAASATAAAAAMPHSASADNLPSVPLPTAPPSDNTTE